MNPTIDHYILSSFREFLDYKVMTKLSAFEPKTLNLYRDSTDDRMSGHYSLYSSGNPQWVYDSSIASVPSSVSHSGGTKNRGDDNMRIDFKNGRIIMDSGSTLTSPTINCNVKYFNSYVATLPDEQLFINTLFKREPEQKDITSHVKGDSFFGPCYFIKMFTGFNEGFELGGLDKTIYNIRVFILTRSEFELIALGGIMRDLYLCSFGVLDSTPLNEFGDLKTVGWDYTTSPKTRGRCEIEDVRFVRIEPTSLASQFASIYPAFCNFKIFTTRFTRS